MFQKNNNNKLRPPVPSCIETMKHLHATITGFYNSILKNHFEEGVL